MEEPPQQADHLEEDESFLTPEHVEDEREDDHAPGAAPGGLGVPPPPD